MKTTNACVNLNSKRKVERAGSKYHPYSNRNWLVKSARARKEGGKRRSERKPLIDGNRENAFKRLESRYERGE